MGVKKYADGSTFEGFWRDGRKHGVGVFRPAEPEKKPGGLRRAGSLTKAGIPEGRSSNPQVPVNDKSHDQPLTAADSVIGGEFSEV